MIRTSHLILSFALLFAVFNSPDSQTLTSEAHLQKGVLQKINVSLPSVEKKKAYKAALVPVQKPVRTANKTLNTKPITSNFEDTIILAEAKVVRDRDLGEMRGGFVDPTGLIFKFAVDVQSQVNGALAYVRSLVLQADGAGQMQASSSSNVMQQNLPSGTTASVVNNGAGIVISSQEGQQTTMINQAANGAITNVVLNTANDMNISQVVNIDLVLKSIDPLMGQFSNLKNMNAPGGLNQIARTHSVGFGF